MPDTPTLTDAQWDALVQARLYMARFWKHNVGVRRRRAADQSAAANVETQVDLG